MNCNDLDLSKSLNITLGNYNYSIPLENLVSNTTYNGRVDCDLYISSLLDET